MRLTHRLTLLTAALAGFMSISVMAAAGVGAPEVNPASATLSMTSSDLASTQCTGEDGETYFTVKGLWSGTETEFPAPMSTDYSLAGDLTYRASVTFRLNDLAGVMTGIGTLKTLPIRPGGRPGPTLYSGPLTLVVGLSPINSPGLISGRGLLQATALLNGVADGSVVANVEVNFLVSGSGPEALVATIDGQFGTDAAVGPQPVIPDYSVATNTKSCF